MIPKIIHYVWLSGESMPKLHKDCLDSWKKYMPEYEFKMWSLQNLPSEVLNHRFVSEAIKEKKWAFATDYIRLWVLYEFGGIYLDLDVEVYRSLNPFLHHSAFCCIEFNPINFYKYIKKRKVSYIYGLNIEAAILGSIHKHPWIKSILEYYDIVEFNKDKINELIMPLIITKQSLDFGFKYIPIYQVLDCDVHIYPPDTFSSCYDLSITKCKETEIGRNCIRYARHKCAHSWYEEKKYDTCSYRIKKLILNIVGKKIISKIKNIFKGKNIIDSNI